MKTKNVHTVEQNKIFFWVALGTMVLLAIPFTFMEFNTPLYDPGSGYEVINWNPADFIVMGILVFSSVSLFILLARKIQKTVYRIALAIIFILGFFWLWAELAVGVFTNWGN